MMDTESLSESCERSFQNSRAFFEDLGLCMSSMEKLIKKNGTTDELRSLYVDIVKLKLSFLEQSREYLGLVNEITTDAELKTLLETAVSDNVDDIADTHSMLDKFK
ncbi:MAG TPA: hypothetical protein VLJ68_03805 [Chitinophagaceae bacterium]|nr:hypothetical protein [Chitinophagaceae bacterium]